MNNELFDRANERYRLRDYRGALMAFTECLQDTNFPLTPGEMGLLYHQRLARRGVCTTRSATAW